ncbi:MAG: cobalamin-dependent protein [Desulfuromonadales bacterium]
MSHLQIGLKNDRLELASLVAAELLRSGLPAFKQDISQLLAYLNETLERGSVKLLSTHLAASRHVSYLTTRRHLFYASDPRLELFLECITKVLREQLSPEASSRCASFLDAAISSYLEHVNHSGHDTCGDNRFAEIATDYLAALLSSNREGAQQIITAALERDDVSIKDIYLHVFQPVQYELGHLWLQNKISVSEEHYCTAATQTIMSDLYPQTISPHRIGKTVVAACIGSELHEIGVRMVVDFFEMDGWDTFYLGSAATLNTLATAIDTHKADLVALSATMTYHIPDMRKLITAVRTAFPERTPLIMVGGMPFVADHDLWRQVGADVWATDAEQAIRVATDRV